LRSSAATYYVDYVGGSDASAGTSTGTAFQRCPGDYRATGTALSTSLAAGDIVYFKGGVTNVVTRTNGICITVSASGSTASKITFQGGESVGWGTGKPVFTDLHNYYGSGEIGTTVFGSTSTRSNLVFRNLRFAELGGSATLPVDVGVATNRNTGIGVNFSNGGRDLYFDGCEFAELGYYFNAPPMGSSSISGLAIQVIDPDGVTVTNCDFTRMNIGLEMYGSTYVTNLTVVSNRFTASMKWLVDIAGAASSRYGAINCYGNAAYDFGEFGATTWTGYGEWPHVDCFFLRRDSAGMQYSTNEGPTGINFYCNTFYETNDAGANGTACIYITAGPSANVYSNTFVTTKKSRSIYVNGTAPSGVTPQVVRIYNNTFLEDYQNAIDLASTSGGGTILAQEITIRDNILYDLRVGSGANTILYFQSASLATNFSVNRNLYYSFNTSTQWFSWVGVGNGGLTLLQANGLEANGQFTDPLFTDISYGTGYDSYLNDLHLQSGSPARGTGTSGGDIGAFPFVSSTTYRGFQFGSGVKLIGPGRLTQ
jgi:hypothetical protein